MVLHLAMLDYLSILMFRIIFHYLCLELASDRETELGVRVGEKYLGWSGVGWTACEEL